MLHDLEAIVATLASIATVIALAWAVITYRRGAKDRLEERAADITGVTLSFRLEKPTEAEVYDKRGLFRYKWELHNPGRLPISTVRVDLRFRMPVSRSRHDGTADHPKKDHEMTTPAIGGGRTHCWTRAYSIAVSDWSSLRDTEGAITFDTPDAGTIQLPWPPSAAVKRSRIRELIPQPARYERPRPKTSHV